MLLTSPSQAQAFPSFELYHKCITFAIHMYYFYHFYIFQKSIWAKKEDCHSCDSPFSKFKIQNPHNPPAKTGDK